MADPEKLSLNSRPLLIECAAAVLSESVAENSFRPALAPVASFPVDFRLGPIVDLQVLTAKSYCLFLQIFVSGFLIQQRFTHSGRKKTVR